MLSGRRHPDLTGRDEIAKGLADGIFTILSVAMELTDYIVDVDVPMRAILPFLAIMALVVLLFAYVPWIIIGV